MNRAAASRHAHLPINGLIMWGMGYAWSRTRHQRNQRPPRPVGRLDSTGVV